MDQIPEYVDERQKYWCIHCGHPIGSTETNRDHVPTKSLLLKPYPENLPVVKICKSCNQGFSQDEEYFAAFLSCILSGSTDPEKQRNPRSRHILETRPSLRERIERSKTEYRAVDGNTRIVWQPESERINRIIVKNARGHAFYEFGESMLEEPTHVWSSPLETMTEQKRSEFETVNQEEICGWPEVGSRMLTRMLTGQDVSGDWVVVQDWVYRYTVAQQGYMVVRSVLFEYLATAVFWSG